MLVDLAAALRYKRKKASAVNFPKLTLLSLVTSTPVSVPAALQTAPISQQRSSLALIYEAGFLYFRCHNMRINCCDKVPAQHIFSLHAAKASV